MAIEQNAYPNHGSPSFGSPNFGNDGQKLIEWGYQSVESWKQWMDERCTAFVCEAADQFAGMIGAFLGGIGGKAGDMVAKVDGFMSRPAASPSAPTIGQIKAQGFEKSPSPSPELVQQAQMAMGSPNQFHVQDMPGHDHNFFPTQTPGMGMGMGGYSMSV